MQGRYWLIILIFLILSFVLVTVFSSKGNELSIPSNINIEVFREGFKECLERQDGIGMTCEDLLIKDPYAYQPFIQHALIDDLKKNGIIK